MPLRNARPVTFSPRTLSDTVDGTNEQEGALLLAKDLVPSMHSRNVWVPRPASYKSFDFSSFTGPISGEALFESGDLVYGWVASGRNPGNSEPFCYNLETRAFVPIQGVTAGNTPVSTPPTGEWIPPTITKVGGYVLFTHPGFSLPNAFGWLDATSLSDTATGNTSAGGTVITTLSKNVFNAGWRAGQIITDSAQVVPPGTTITSVSRDGLSIVLSQATTALVTGDTITVTGGTAASPLWAAGNTSINPLPGIANAVQIFNGRAWYAVDNAVNFSDAGDPLVKSNASQVITLQNGLTITAEETIPFNNATVIGGIVNALLLVQGNAGMWQVTGDQATTNLALNFLSPLGTLAPLTLTSCPLGLFFVAPDGVRIIQLDGTISDPIGTNGDGVALPFVNAEFSSRMCAAFNEDVLRISVTGDMTTGGSAVPDSQAVEYWFHMKLKAWSGPHSFPAKLIVATNRTRINHGFLLFPLIRPNLAVGPLGSAGRELGSGNSVLATGGTVPPTLPEVWFSNTRPVIDSTYIENGKQMTWTYATSLLPDTAQMAQNMFVETTMMLGLSPPGSFTVEPESLWDEMVWDVDAWDGATPVQVPNPGQTAVVGAYNEAGVLLAQATINGFVPFANGTQLPAAPPSLWDTMVWDRSLWSTDPGGAIIAQRRVPWPRPVVFKQTIIQVSSESSPHVAIGNVYLRYQQLGYLVADYANVVANGQPGIIAATAP
jgi:hypothetical protein